MLFLATSLLIAIAAAVATPVQKTPFHLPPTRIIGGNPARAGQYPFAASITQVTPSGRFFCGGALISRRWVLTAAHCTLEATLFVVNIGSNHLDIEDPNKVTVSTSEFVPHPFFSPDTHVADIGLIEFRQEIVYNDYIQAITIPIINIQEDVEVQAIGWGSISDDDSDLHEDLLTTKLTAISNTECQVVYGDQVTGDMVCVAGNNNEGACRGDLGGPLVQYLHNHAFHVGVSSFISGNGCETADPSGYIRTYTYREWIRDTANVTVGPDTKKL